MGAFFGDATKLGEDSVCPFFSLAKIQDTTKFVN
jgi:hypothetical protein